MYFSCSVQSQTCLYFYLLKCKHSIDSLTRLSCYKDNVLGSYVLVWRWCYSALSFSYSAIYAVVIDVWGSLAIPSNQQHHDFLYNEGNAQFLPRGFNAFWLGMSDVTTEGDWKSVVGDVINTPPNFPGKLTSCNVLTMYLQFSR